MCGDSVKPDRGPVPATISFSLTQQAAADLATTVDLLSGIWSTLQTSGLVLARPAEFWRPRGTNDQLLLHVLFCSSSMAGSWLQNPDVTAAHGESMSALLVRPPETRCYADLFRGEHLICTCTASNGYIVEGGDPDSLSPVICLQCDGRLLDTSPESGATVDEWASAYTRVQRIWFEGVVLDSWSAEQLSNPKGELIQLGLAACAGLEARLTAPVYLRIRQWCSETGDLLATVQCPLCGSSGEQLADRRALLVCRECRLAFE